MIIDSNRAESHTASQYLEQTVQASQPFFLWLIKLDEKSLHKAFIYSGYTESSYLNMAWEDYCHNKTEFLFQWSSVLSTYYQYSR